MDRSVEEVRWAVKTGAEVWKAELGGCVSREGALDAIGTARRTEPASKQDRPGQ